MTRPAHEIGREVIQRERDALDRLAEELGAAFDRPWTCCSPAGAACRVTGMGKSGHVGRKIAATLVSTGTPSAFLHPAEGFHGDVGIVTSRDVVLAISQLRARRARCMELVPVIRDLGATRRSR